VIRKLQQLLLAGNTSKLAHWPLRYAFQDPEDMKLVLVSTGVELDDAKLLSDLKVQNDDVVGLCYKKEAVEGMPQ
jgi:hypothetical protein